MDPAYAQGYARLYRQHFWWRARERLLLDVLDASPFPRGGDVLDIGCGDGLFFDRLARYGRVQGVESDATLVSAGGPHRSVIHVGPFDARYAPTERFSLIVALDVLEHLDEPEQALRHALSLLRPDGALVLTLPAFDLLWSHHDELNQHRMRYTRARFARLAEQAGMRVDRLQYVFHWLFLAKLASGLRERLSPNSAEPVRVPHALFNVVAYGLCRLEQQLFTNHPLPIGSSLLAIGGSKPRA
jgi:SAM-dependent methyltransferase